MTSPSREPSAAPFTIPGIDDVAADESLVARARGLESIVREHAETTERERRLSGRVLRAMREAGFFRMFTPRALGGLETDPVTVARVAEEIASFDSAAAWALQAGNTGSWWAGHFPENGIAELFADGPDLLMAASFSPPHRAEAVSGGYRFTGRGPLASTIHDSPWVMMTGIVFDGDQVRTTPTVENRVKNRSGAFSSKRLGAGRHFIEHDSERKQIGACVQRRCPDLLG